MYLIYLPGSSVSLPRSCLIHLSSMRKKGLWTQVSLNSPPVSTKDTGVGFCANSTGNLKEWARKGAGVGDDFTIIKNSLSKPCTCQRRAVGTNAGTEERNVPELGVGLRPSAHAAPGPGPGCGGKAAVFGGWSRVWTFKGLTCYRVHPGGF